MSPASDPSQLAQYNNTEQLYNYLYNNNPTKISNVNTVAPTFWDQHEAANFAFQEVQLLNIIARYAYIKLLCCTPSLGGKEYIQKLITTAHPHHC